MPHQPPDDGEWEEAMKGIYVIIVTLGWWALGAKFSNHDMMAWNKAVSDVTWVISQMMPIVQETRKREWEDDNNKAQSATSFQLKLPRSKQ